MTDHDTPPADIDLQMSAGPITDAFHRHDLAMLAQLTPEQRAIQAQIRQALHLYVDRIWEEPKHREGRSPVDIGGYGSVAALRDLLNTLCDHAAEAQYAAGDIHEEYRVTVTAEKID